MSELARAVGRAVATLPARRREAFGLYYRHGLSYAEVGAVMGVTWKMARKHIHEGAKAVRASVPSELRDEYFADA